MAIVDESSLEKVRAALESSGNSYLNNYKKLQALVNDVRSGVIKGPIADQFVAKFAEKEDTFNNIRKTIEEAESFMADEKNKFNNMMSDLSAGMR